MSFRLPAPRLFAFDRAGSNLDHLAITKKSVLVITNGPFMDERLDALIEQIIRHDSATLTHHFDATDPNDQIYVLQHLAPAGHTAYFLPVKTYLAI